MINLNRCKLHIFDLDDTLINTRYSYKWAQQQAIIHSFPEVSPERILETIPTLKWICKKFGSGNIEDYMAAYLKSHDSLFPMGIMRLHTVIEEYYRIFYSELVPFDGAKTYLKALTGDQHSIALVSNGIVESQLKKLEFSEYAEFFPKDARFISGNYLPSLQKPSPYMILLACESSGVAPEDSVFYGNSVDDMLAGNLAGVTTIHFSGSTPLPSDLPEVGKPHFEFDSWSEMLSCYQDV